MPAGFFARMRVDLRRAVPLWVGELFALCALALVPWTVFLGLSLPPDNTSTHWDVTWVGFDAMLIAALATTGVLAWRGSRRVELPAAALAVLLVVDAWVDVTTAERGWALLEAVAEAALVELPMAAFALYINLRVEAVITRAERRIRRDVVVLDVEPLRAALDKAAELATGPAAVRPLAYDADVSQPLLADAGPPENGAQPASDAPATTDGATTDGATAEGATADGSAPAGVQSSKRDGPGPAPAGG